MTLLPEFTYEVVWVFFYYKKGKEKYSILLIPKDKMKCFKLFTESKKLPVNVIKIFWKKKYISLATFA